MNKLFTTLSIVAFALSSYATPAFTHEEAYVKGEQAFQSGNYEEALNNLNAAISEASDRYKYFYLRALVNKNLERPEDAIADFTRAINLKPAAEALYERGVLHLDNGDMDAAKSDFEDVEMVGNNFKNIQYYLGLIYYRAGVHEYAVKSFKSYVSLTGGDGETFYYLGLAQASLKWYDAAIENLSKALPYKKNNLLIHVKMYDLYVQMNKTEKAIESLSAMIENEQWQQKRRILFRAQLTLLATW
jgi:tetratricopeptide (TPR) repeat protein